MSVLDPSQRVRPDVAVRCASFAKQAAARLGFQALGISSIDLTEDEQHLVRWLAAGRHGEMDYMQGTASNVLDPTIWSQERSAC